MTGRRAGVLLPGGPGADARQPDREVADVGRRRSPTNSEREKARQRTYDAMQRKAKAGHVTGGRVFGYDNVGCDWRRRPALARRAADQRGRGRRRAADLRALAAEGYGRKRDRATLERGRRAVAAGAAGPARGLGAVVGPRGAPPAALPRRDRLEPDAEARPVGPAAARRRGRRRNGCVSTAPDLRIVAEDVWQAAHERLTRRRAVYLNRRVDGPAAGRWPGPSRRTC